MTVLATWRFGRIAARAALDELKRGGSALDAAVAGAQAVEDDPSVMSVGFGGLANAIGDVQLDACVMEGATLNCGAVAGLENVRHPTAVARRVMEATPHLLLVGDGARLFAVQQGFQLESLNTPESVAEWQRRRGKKIPRARGASKDARHSLASATGSRPSGSRAADSRDARSNVADSSLTHDTVGILVCDERGRLAGACSTSGLSHKLPGRVGDSPLIGGALYVDEAAGAAAATGVGEEIVRAGGVVLIVEMMRQGRTPQEACEAMIARINDVAARRGVQPAEVGVLALNSRGEIGAASTKPTDFAYAIGNAGRVSLRKGARVSG